MGNWNISINGVGCHHDIDDNQLDANLMASEFVKQLKAAGHSVGHATFTHGGADDINPVNGPAADPKADASES